MDYLKKAKKGKLNQRTDPIQQDQNEGICPTSNNIQYVSNITMH